MSPANPESRRGQDGIIIRTALASATGYWLLESAIDSWTRADTLTWFDGLIPPDPHEWWSRLSVLLVFALTAALTLRLTRRWQLARRQADAVLAATTDAYIDLDREWRIRQLNPRAEELLGVRAEAVSGDVFWDVFPEAASHFYLPLKRSMRTQQGTLVRGEYPPLDRFIEVHTAPRPDGISFYFRDQTQIREHERELQENNVRLQAILDSTVDGIISINEFGIVESFNHAAQTIFGYSPTEVIGRNIAMLMPEEVGAKHDGFITSYLRTGVSRIIDVGPREVTARRKDGSEFPMDLAVGQMRLDDQVYFVGIVRDISDRKRSELELRRSRAMLAKAQQIAHMGSWEWDVASGRLTWSDEIFRIFGAEPGSFEPTYEAFLARLHPDDLDGVAQAVQQALEGRADYNIEHRIRLPDGEQRYVHEQGEVLREQGGKAIRMVGTVQDVTERKEAQQTIEFMENFDPLTGLPNRTLLRYRLEQAVSQAHRERRLVGVLFLGLDRFKAVNDTFGHATGDHVLRIAASRLSAAVREGDTVARIGGDEFAVLLDGMESIDAMATEARALNEAIRLPLELEGTELFTTASIGISVYPHDGRNPELLLRNADAALHRAKEEGPENYQFFTTDMTAGSAARMQLERDLRRAVERHEFELHYQPQIALATGEVVGVEALLRWRHPEKGIISPGTFIPVLEQTGMILPVGNWVLEAACRQNSAWQQSGLPPLRVAVNLSALQFRQTDLAAQVDGMLAATGLAADYLELEITEGLLVENVDLAISTLDALHRMGVQVSIDDFGTGYSSMSYLQQFPVTTLKLDRTFVADVSVNADSAAIARAVIALGHSLRLKVIAEGVETPDQHRFLAREHCDEVQGFLYARPMPAEELSRWLADYRPADGVDMAKQALI